MSNDSRQAPPILQLDPETRAELWPRVIEAVEAYITGVGGGRVATVPDPEQVRSLLSVFDFAQPVTPGPAVDFIVDGLWNNQTHTAHPWYFGLFNPAPTTMGIAADTLVAAFNPQLAAWSHSPLAVEIEQHLIRAFGSRFGYDPAAMDGSFTTCGGESNNTALLVALTHLYPDYREKGVRALPGQPVIYVSSESHHTFLKAAQASGLGTEAVHEVGVDTSLRMDAGALRTRISEDRAAGYLPVMAVATAGTTSGGIVDPMAQLADVAQEEGLWLHADAAWGGAIALAPERAWVLDGIDRADSITFDAHKWLSAPMGAGMFFTRHPDILTRTFAVNTPYMPIDPEAETINPAMHSMQWSHRFIGLKVFLALAVAGWDGYAAVIEHQAMLGDRLRAGLAADGWEIVNDTPLPVICFADSTSAEGTTVDYLKGIVDTVNDAGKAWISFTRIGPDFRPVIRACISNYRTGPDEVDGLVRLLGETRDGMRIG